MKPLRRGRLNQELARLLGCRDILHICFRQLSPIGKEKMMKEEVGMAEDVAAGGQCPFLDLQ